MDELILAKTRYEDLIARMDEDMEAADQFKADLVRRYSATMPLDALVTVQSQILRIQDYITQKFNNKVEILRAYDDLVKAIEEAEAKVE